MENDILLEWILTEIWSRTLENVQGLPPLTYIEKTAILNFLTSRKVPRTTRLVTYTILNCQIGDRV